MSITSIESVLQQMRAVSVRSGIGAATPAAEAGTFGESLKRSLDRISDSQETAYARADAFEMGVPGVSLNDTMLGIQKANIGLQFGVQVRNRLVAAYQEIMNLPA